MAESNKGHNYPIRGPTEKNTCLLIFVLMLHIKLQVPSSSGSLVLQPTTLLYWKSRKVALLSQHFPELAQKLITSSKH